MESITETCDHVETQEEGEQRQFLEATAGRELEHEDVIAICETPRAVTSVMEYTVALSEGQFERRYARIPPALRLPTYEALRRFYPFGVSENALFFRKTCWMVRVILRVCNGYLVHEPFPCERDDEPRVFHASLNDGPFDAASHLMGLGVEKSNAVAHFVLDQLVTTTPFVPEVLLDLLGDENREILVARVAAGMEDALARQYGRELRAWLREREELERSRDDYKRKAEAYKAQASEGGCGTRTY